MYFLLSGDTDTQMPPSLTTRKFYLFSTDSFQFIQYSIKNIIIETNLFFLFVRKASWENHQRPNKKRDAPTSLFISHTNQPYFQIFGRSRYRKGREPGGLEFITNQISPEKSANIWVRKPFLTLVPCRGCRTPL